MTAGPQRGRRRNLEVSDEEFARVKRLVLGKARRYSLEPVSVSDRLVVSFSPEQLARLVTELAGEDPPVTVEWRDQTGYGAEIAALSMAHPSRFGGDPPRGSGHPKSVDWGIVTNQGDKT